LRRRNEGDLGPSLRVWSRTGGACLLAFALLLAGPLSGTTGRPLAAKSGGTWSGSSWGEGVVVQEGAGTEDGGTVSWETATNVTVVLRIPEINSTDGTIYAILSLMTNGGSTLQVAAGIYPNGSHWQTYAMYILDLKAVPQVYTPVLLAGEPTMSPGAEVSLSIYFAPGGWRLEVADFGTGQSVDAPFGAGLPGVLMDGDQEVFALESYTSSAYVFQNMGNLTLERILVDGSEVSTGWYDYSDWDGIHNPLFVVGGSNPPQFMAQERGADGAWTWGYYEPWGGSPAAPLFDPRIAVAVPIVGVWAAAVIMVMVARSRTRRRVP
jgi:hypothetical protein